MKTNNDYLQDCCHILAELQKQIMFIEEDIRKHEETVNKSPKSIEFNGFKHPDAGLKDLKHKYTVIKEVKYTLDQAKRTLSEYKID
ncbi:MAG: hypothetical protein ACM3PX_10575 [Omnitrophica WOR_2 bacterium]